MLFLRQAPEETLAPQALALALVEFHKSALALELAHLMA
jgi:hypothetical protein